MIWYEENKNTAVVKMYADIAWWAVNARNCTDLLENLDRKYDTVKIRMHCYGGNVFEGNPIANAISSMKAKTIGIVEGVCMSMGTILLNECDEIWVCENAILMYHAPTGYTQGNAKDHEQAAKLLRSLEKNFGKAYSRRSGRPVSEVKEFFDGSDHYFDSDEAIALGLADKKIEPVVKDIKKLSKPDSKDIDPEDLYNKFAAHLDYDEEEEENNDRKKPGAGKKRHQKKIIEPTASGSDNNSTTKNDAYMKKLLIDSLGLQNVTADSSDSAILDAVKAVMNQKDEKITALEKEVQEGVKAEAERLIATAEQASGKQFTDDQKATMLSVADKAGIESLQSTIAMIAPNAAGDQGNNGGTPHIQKVIVSNSDGSNPESKSRNDWTWDEWQEKDAEGLENMESQNWDAFAKLYEAKFKVKPEKVS